MPWDSCLPMPHNASGHFCLQTCLPQHLGAGLLLISRNVLGQPWGSPAYLRMPWGRVRPGTWFIFSLRSFISRSRPWIMRLMSLMRGPKLASSLSSFDFSCGRVCVCKGQGSRSRVRQSLPTSPALSQITTPTNSRRNDPSQLLYLEIQSKGAGF